MNFDPFNPNGANPNGWLRGYGYGCSPTSHDLSAYEQELMQAITTQQTAQMTSRIGTLRNALGQKAAEPEPPDDGNLHIRIKRKKIEFNFNN